MPNGSLVISIVGSVFGTLILCRFAAPLCQALQLIDKPNSRKLHPVPTPLLGGLALLFVGVPSIFLNLFVSTSADSTNNLLLVLGLASATMTLVGLADDRHDLTARDRLLISFLVFFSVGVFDPRFVVRTLEFHTIGIEVGLFSGPIARACTIIFCVGFVNALNMADGKNGLVTGLCLGWILFLATQSTSTFLPVLAPLGSMVAVLFVYNVRGKLFLGDGGAYGLATAIGLITIAIYNSPEADNGRALYAEEIGLLFAAPVFDAVRLAVSRIAQGRSPMSADRDHLHHHLQTRFGWPGGLIAYHLLAIMLPVLCIFLLRIWRI